MSGFRTLKGRFTDSCLVGGGDILFLTRISKIAYWFVIMLSDNSPYTIETRADRSPLFRFLLWPSSYRM